MSASIFDLDSPDDIRTNGTTSEKLVQVQPSRDCTNANFVGGPIVFRFGSASDEYIVPRYSYLKMRLTLQDTTAGRLLSRLEKYLAPNINLGANFWQSATWRVGNFVCSRLADYVPEITALETRMTKGTNWRTTFGQASNCTAESIAERAAEIQENWIPALTTTRSVVHPNSAADAAKNWEAASAGALVTFQFAMATVMADAINVANLPVVGDWVNFEDISQQGSWQPVRVIAITNAPRLIITCADPRSYYTNVAAGSINIQSLQVLVDPPLRPHKRSKQIEICFALPLGVWKHNKGIPGANHYLELVPKTAAEIHACIIETMGSASHPVADFNWSVDQFHLMVYKAKGPPIGTATVALDLNQTKLTKTSMTTASWSEKTSDVNPSTYALSVAFQGNTVNNDTRTSAGRFTIPDDFRSYRTDLGTSLTRFSLQYGDQLYPQPDADPLFKREYDTDGIGLTDANQRTERYLQTMMNTGLAYSIDPPSEAEFYARGPYYHWRTPTDDTQTDTRVTVKTQFTDASIAGLDASIRARGQILLFEHYRRIILLHYKEGSLAAVEGMDQ